MKTNNEVYSDPALIKSSPVSLCSIPQYFLGKDSPESIEIDISAFLDNEKHITNKREKND